MIPSLSQSPLSWFAPLDAWDFVWIVLLLQPIDFRLTSGYLIVMRFRAFSMVVLVIAITTFTGLPTSVSASLQDKAEGSCCGACNQGNEKNPDQCSTPECPVFLCLTADLGSSFALPVPFERAYIPQFPGEPSLKPFPKLIYHPPEIV